MIGKFQKNSRQKIIISSISWSINQLIFQKYIGMTNIRPHGFNNARILVSGKDFIIMIGFLSEEELLSITEANRSILDLSIKDIYTV